MVRKEGDGAVVVVRALSVADARRRARRECARAFGEEAWQIADESIAPCLATLGGRTRLYEGRFVATRP